MYNKKGFTLIEMIICIAVIIVLATISVPMYKDHVLKAKKAEGIVLLCAIKEAQLNYYNEYGNFLAARQSSAGGNFYTNNEEVLGINAITNKYYTWFTVGWACSYEMFSAFAANSEIGTMALTYWVTANQTTNW